MGRWTRDIPTANEITGTKWRHLFIGSTFARCKEIESYLGFLIVKVAPHWVTDVE